MTLNTLYNPLRVLLVAGSAVQQAMLATALAKLTPAGELVVCQKLSRALTAYQHNPCDVVLLVGPLAICRDLLHDVFSLARNRNSFVYGGHIEPGGTNIGWCATADVVSPQTQWSPEIDGVLALKLRSIQAFRQLWLGYTETARLQLSMLEHIRDGVLLLDSEDKVVHANSVAERILGMGQEAMRGQVASVLLDSVEGTAPLVAPIPPMRIPGHAEWRMVMFRNGITSGLQDDTPALLQDVLTGLPTHVLMQDRLSKAVHLATRYSRNLAVMRIQVDPGTYAQLSETYGYSTGDMVLCEIARRLAATVRTVDTVARGDGCSFVAVLQELSQPEDAQLVAQRMVQTCQAPIEVEPGLTLEVPVYVGLANFPEHGKTAKELMSRAETALERVQVRAAHTGEQIGLYSAQLAVRADRPLLERQLLSVLDENELLMFYQPQMDVASGRVVGAEALVRWDHKGQLRGPENIIPIAEEMDLIGRITHWALREAIRQAADWKLHGRELSVAVNIPPSEFTDDLLRYVSGALIEFNLPAHLLELEVTESGLNAQHTEALRVMRQLTQMGVKLAMDDFGTGYSSLDRLKSFPLHALKIDKNFISAIQSARLVNGQVVCTQDATKDVAILRAVVTLAKTLEMQTVAEGIEASGQLDVVRHLGVTTWQGYYASPALPAENVLPWLHHWELQSAA